MTKTRIDHDDYEAAFQAAEHIAQTHLGCSVEPKPIASPHVDGWYTWAFKPTRDRHPRDELRPSVKRVEVKMDKQTINVSLTRGDPANPHMIAEYQLEA